MAALLIEYRCREPFTDERNLMHSVRFFKSSDVCTGLKSCLLKQMRLANIFSFGVLVMHKTTKKRSHEGAIHACIIIIYTVSFVRIVWRVSDYSDTVHTDIPEAEFRWVMTDYSIQMNDDLWHVRFRASFNIIWTLFFLRRVAMVFIKVAHEIRTQNKRLYINKFLALMSLKHPENWHQFNICLLSYISQKFQDHCMSQAISRIQNMGKNSELIWNRISILKQGYSFLNEALSRSESMLSCLNHSSFIWLNLANEENTPTLLVKWESDKPNLKAWLTSRRLLW